MLTHVAMDTPMLIAAAERQNVSTSRVFSYLDANNLLPPCQSGFRKDHSTESLLLLPTVPWTYGAMSRYQVNLLVFTRWTMILCCASFDLIQESALRPLLHILFTVGIV